MASFLNALLVLTVAFGSQISAANSSVARSMFEMEEGVYAPTSNYCAVILRYPYDKPGKLVLEYVANPFQVPAVACGSQGVIVEFSPQAEDGSVAEDASKRRLSRTSARSFKFQWMDSSGNLTAGIVHSRAH